MNFIFVVIRQKYFNNGDLSVICIRIGFLCSNTVHDAKKLKPNKEYNIVVVHDLFIYDYAVKCAIDIVRMILIFKPI